MKWRKLPISEGVIKLVSHLRRYDKSEVTRERQKIIRFYDEFGERAAKEAFGVDRKLVYVWRRRIRQRCGISGFVPDSTAPKRVRQPKTHPKIVSFVRERREFAPRMSKKKLKPQVDEYCAKEGMLLNQRTWATSK